MPSWSVIEIECFSFRFCDWRSRGAAFLVTLLVLGQAAVCCGSEAFVDVLVEEPYLSLLKDEPQMMCTSGAHLLEGDSGQLVLLGIGKSIVSDYTTASREEALKVAEIRARSALAGFIHGIVVSGRRNFEEMEGCSLKSSTSVALSSFFSVTIREVQGEIWMLPVVGQWWGPRHEVVYVGVGKVSAKDLSSLLREESKLCTMVGLEGEQPYLTLLQHSPLLCRNGGVRWFDVKGGHKILLSVGSAAVVGGTPGARLKAMRIARMQAQKNLLGVKQKARVRSVKLYAQGERLVLTTAQEEYQYVSDFLSIHEEHISGTIRSLPQVATWEDRNGGRIFVCLGRDFR